MENKEREIQLFMEFLNKMLAGGKPVERPGCTRIAIQDEPICAVSASETEEIRVSLQKEYHFK